MDCIARVPVYCPQARRRAVRRATWLLPAAVLIAGCDQGGGTTDAWNDTMQDTTADTGEVMETDTAADTEPDAPADTADDAEDAVTARVRFVTSMGTFVVGLHGNAAPVTTDNFTRYVDEGFFDGLIFHRVIAGFMIQGGGYDETLTRRAPAHPPIALEIVPWLSHQPGVISMARTSDPDSATSQFFVCVADDSSLDGDYAAFGAVESGYDVVESISLVATHTAGGMDDVPITPVVIESATRL
jgi:peptidyl-prolyl cis-trans isomerase A (cyclophilin A)